MEHIRDVHEMAKATGGQLRHITLRGHGDSWYMKFGNGTDGYINVTDPNNLTSTRTAIDLRNVSGECLSKDGEVVLDGCKTANLNETITKLSTFEALNTTDRMAA